MKQPTIKLLKGEYGSREASIRITWGDGILTDLQIFHPKVICKAHGRSGCGFAEDTCTMMVEQDKRR